jgi:hypothetical protein
MNIKIVFENQTFAQRAERQRIAEFLASTINGYYCFCANGFPYKPNLPDDYFWTLDEGNDWKVRFFEDHAKSFQIIHRYNNYEAIKGLSEWVAFRLGGKVLVE